MTLRAASTMFSRSFLLGVPAATPRTEDVRILRALAVSRAAVPVNFSLPWLKKQQQCMHTDRWIDLKGRRRREKKRQGKEIKEGRKGWRKVSKERRKDR